MATKSTVRDSHPLIYKFTAVDCIAGETLETIDCSGFDYAVLYGVINTNTSGAGSGTLSARAQLPDAAASALIYSFDTDSDGEFEDEQQIVLTSPTAILGSVPTHLPASLTLVHDGGNTGTVLTVDIYVELHRRP